MKGLDRYITGNYGEDQFANTVECAYCDGLVDIDSEWVPQTDAEWAREAEAHNLGCEWVETRAFTLPLVSRQEAH